MDSRLSSEYNIRAAKLRMIPGGAYGLAVNVNEGGESDFTIIKREPVKSICTNMDYVPTTEELVRMREFDVHMYENNPYETGSTFTDVLGANALNQQYTKIKKSDLSGRAFPIIETEKYPEKPAEWQMLSGLNTRFFGRTDAVRYNK